MYASVQRPLGLSALRTLLAAFAILALVFSALGITRPVLASEHIHCPGGEEGGAPPGAIESSEGSIEDADGTSLDISWGGDPGSITFDNTDGDTDVIVVWCAKGGDGFSGDSMHTGEQQTLVEAGESVTVGPFGTAISYFVLYEVIEQEPEDGQIELVKAVDPTEDDGLFVLSITVGETTTSSDPGGHGTSVGPVTVAADTTVTVGEVASGDTDLADYSTSISCIDADTEDAVTASQVNGTSWSVTVGEGQNVVCTITNVRAEDQPDTGTLEIEKWLCEGEGETQFVIAGPASTQQVELDCDPQGGVTFSILSYDPGTETVGAEVTTATTEDDPESEHFGTAHVTLDVGWYVISEGEAQSEPFEIAAGSLTRVSVFNFRGEEDETGQIKVTKWFCVGEEDVVYVLPGESSPNPFDHECVPGGAEFDVFDSEDNLVGTITVGSDGLGLSEPLDPGQYYLVETDPDTGATSGLITVVVGDPVAVSVFNFAPEQVGEGQIDIVKQLEEGECPLCPTRTPGFWFNLGGGGAQNDPDIDVDSMLQAIPDLEGFPEFNSVEDVQNYLEADRSGELDGQRGLSMTGQLLRHYLALELNVMLTDCPWEEITFAGRPIAGEGSWLELARQALEEDWSDAEKEEIKDALDAINNANLGDDTLECPEDTTGGTVAGVVFELWIEGEEEPLVSDPTGSDGMVSFTGLPLDVPLTIVERDPPGFDCSIVEAFVDGDPIEVNDDGSVTVTLSEEMATITLTLVNVCEEIEDEEEEEFGEIIAIKVTDEDEPSETFDFTLDEAAFGSIMSGGVLASGDLEEDSYVLAEVLTEAQVEAGWTLDDIVCIGIEGRVDLAAVVDVLDEDVGLFEPDVTPSGEAGVEINLAADTTVVCIFVNLGPEDQVGEEETGRITIVKVTVPGGGTGFDFTLSGDDSDTATLNHGQAMSWLLEAGGDYTVTEAEEDDWELASIVCSAGANVSLSTRSFTVEDLGEGANVTCVFTNTQGEGGVQPGVSQPGGEQDVRGGQGLPDTATGQSGEPTAPLPLALLAVMGLAAATIGSRRMLAERRA